MLVLDHSLSCNISMSSTEVCAQPRRMLLDSEKDDTRNHLKAMVSNADSGLWCMPLQCCTAPQQ